MKTTSIKDWHGFILGQQVTMLVETRGATAADHEVAHPIDTSAFIAAIADFGPHQGCGVDLVIGNSDRAICNSFDDRDRDALGHLPFMAA
jgi:hypothetical protein